MTQATALAILKTGTNVFLTGEPGSGKTYLINQYIRYLRAHQIAVAVTASTGIAATHIDGRTIHSWAGIGIKKILTPPELTALKANHRLARRVKAAQALIIDEISMLDASTLDLVQLVCQVLRRPNAPFGGLQVILVGDFFQLPPISSRDEQAAEFAFNAECWREALFDVCYLTEQHRQSDPALTKVLADIRQGTISQQAIDHLGTRRVTHHDEHAVPTKLYSHNTNVDQVNTDKLAQLSGESRIFTMSTQGPKPLVEGLVKTCLSPERLELKIGTAVMCTKNNPEIGFVNGTLATVTGFEPEEGYPIITTKSGRTMTITPMDWTIAEGDKLAAKITQVPLKLAWAITIHKSQGMSLDAAVMDLSHSFAFGQGYVALSRVRTLSGLHLLGWNERALLTDPAIQDQDIQLREQSAKAERDWEGVTAPQQAKRQADFIRASTRHHKGTGQGRKMPSSTPRTTDNPAEPSAPSTAYAERLITIRKKYPQAYMPWTEEADRMITEMYTGEVSIKKISDTLQRQPGAIRSRLKHLGLVG